MGELDALRDEMSDMVKVHPKLAEIADQMGELEALRGEIYSMLTPK